MSGSTKEWIRPDELMKIQRKKQKLKERLNHQSTVNRAQQPSTGIQNIFTSEKRSNPFAKSLDRSSKRTRPDLPTASDETIFELLHCTASKPAANLEAPAQESPTKEDLYNPILDDDAEHVSDTEVPKPTKNLPVDWSIKSRLRILSKTLVVSNNLRSNEEASGLTGFVRCLDTKSTSHPLDISNGARFQQNLMYWQYPHLPWLNLIQRNARSNNEFKIQAAESEALLKDWMECFRNLFQLLRALHCPYFYVLANQFTVLFRAAGIGGRCEMHALLTPTTRGFRQLLKEEDIEFTLPLKSSSKEEATPNTSAENCQPNKESDDDDEEDAMKFLESLGVETSDIKFKDDVKTRNKEVEDDNGELSTILIEGADCQAFFNFLLNAKSTVPKVGRLAGIPPTLLSPVAFLGAALRKQTTRSSKLRLEGEDFFSIELRGAILPHTVHTLCNLLSDIRDQFSLTMVNCPRTVAFSKTSRQLLEDLDSSGAVAGQVFGCENLSECGIQNSILERMCQVDSDAVTILERLQFDLENGGYILF